MDEKSDHIFSRYASPSPLWEQFSHISDSFSLVIIMQKYEIEAKKLKDKRLDAYPRNFHAFELIWRIMYVFKLLQKYYLLDRFFLTFKYFYWFFLTILY